MKTQLGALLKELRKDLPLREAAKLIGVSHTYLSLLEKGVDPRTGKEIRPSVEVLQKISKAYNYPYEELLKIVGYIDSPPKPIKQTSNTEPVSKTEDPFFELLRRIENREPDTLTVEEALELVLRSDHVMFDGKPVGEMDEDILLDIRDTVVAILKYKANLKKAVAGMKGVASNCLAAAAGAG